MKNNFFVYPYILFFIAISNFPLIKLYSSQISADKEISVEFLKQLPSNDYIIGPGDSLEIIISRDLGLFSKVSVDGEGTIQLPKLERVYVSGLTINELNKLLNKAYLKFIKFPEVATIITNYRPINVFVDGEVVNPGLQTLAGSLSFPTTNDNLSLFESKNGDTQKDSNYFFPTVFDAIRSSGGITQYSDLKSIQIIRNDSISNGSGKKSATLNFEELLTMGSVSQNIRIYDSDIIKIKRNQNANTNLLAKAILSKLNPKFIKVFVTGRVKRPGFQTVSRVSVLSDAIDMAGGAKIVRGPVTFIRFNPDGTIDKRKMRFTKNKRGQFSNPNLRDGDLIIVGENLLTMTNEVLTEITSPFQGIFSTYALIKAVTD